jgi:hypothetical protein
VIICPSSFHAAFRAAESEDLGAVGNYFFIWNVVDYPAGSIPITEV